MNRRNFIRTAALGIAAVPAMAGSVGSADGSAASKPQRGYFVDPEDLEMAYTGSFTMDGKHYPEDDCGFWLEYVPPEYWPE